MNPFEQMCVICDEAVTNPICFRCFEKGVESWLENREPMLIPFFRDRIEMFSGRNEKGINCIICGENMNVCVHCYGKEIHEWLKEIYPNRKAMVNEFLSIFDFNWHHTLK